MPVVQPRFRVTDQPGYARGRDEALFELLPAKEWPDGIMQSFLIAQPESRYGRLEHGVVNVAAVDARGRDQLGRLPNEFSHLPEGLVSLGQSFAYYEKLANVPGFLGRRALRALNDIVIDPDAHHRASNSPAKGLDPVISRRASSPRCGSALSRY